MATGILFLVLKQMTLLFCFVLLSTPTQPTDLPQQACVCTSQSPPCQPAFPARTAAPSVNDLITRSRPLCPKPVCGQGTAFFCPRFSPSAFPGQPPPPHLLALTKSALQCCSSSSSAPTLPPPPPPPPPPLPPPPPASAWACLASQLRRLNICLYIHVVGNTAMVTELKDTLYMDLVIHGRNISMPAWPPS